VNFESFKGLSGQTLDMHEARDAFGIREALETGLIKEAID